MGASNQMCSCIFMVIKSENIIWLAAAAATTNNS
jgi:hypothetical protein